MRNMVALSEGITVNFIIQMLIVWFIGNIPTIILLAIYFGCRGKQRHNKIDFFSLHLSDWGCKSAVRGL